LSKPTLVLACIGSPLYIWAILNVARDTTHGSGKDKSMKIVRVSAIPMSAPVPKEKRHRTDLGTKVKSDATLIRVETDSGLIGIGAALGTPPIVAAIVEHELAFGMRRRGPHVLRADLREDV
jgi:hypothetical protein